MSRASPEIRKNACNSWRADCVGDLLIAVRRRLRSELAPAIAVSRLGTVTGCRQFWRNRSYFLALPEAVRRMTFTRDSGRGLLSIGSMNGLADSPSSGEAGSGNRERIGGLLSRARRGDRSQLGQLLQLYRNYLTILAATQLDARLRRRMSPSDLVQEAMLGAYRDFDQFRGASERELLAWLRQILIHCLHHAYEAPVQAGSAGAAGAG